jgi:deazaflavin-dependent oxidoreductase (nitroreductase family)
MDPFDATYEPSTWPPSAEQVALYEQTRGEQGSDFMGHRCVILSTIGARSGAVRKTPVIRVDVEGIYVAVGSMGGAPIDPSWVHNLRAEPRCRVQDSAHVHDRTARELTGEEKAVWWQRAASTFPDYDAYQASTDRVIPLFLLEP